MFNAHCSLKLEPHFYCTRAWGKSDHRNNWKSNSILILTVQGHYNPAYLSKYRQHIILNSAISCLPKIQSCVLFSRSCVEEQSGKTATYNFLEHFLCLELIKQHVGLFVLYKYPWCGVLRYETNWPWKSDDNTYTFTGYINTFIY